MFHSASYIAGYLWQYALALFVLLVPAFIGYKKVKGQLSFIFVAAILFLIAALRAQDFTNDTYAYTQIFKEIHFFFYSLTSYMERGYIIYNKLLSLISDNAQTILISNALITIGGYYICFTKYATSPYLALLFFAVNPIDGYVRILNLSREYLAIGIMMTAVPFIVKRRILPFLALWFIAFNFHTSLFLFLPLYFIYPLRFKLKYVLLLCGALLLFLATPLLDTVLNLMSGTMFERYLHYYDGELKVAAVVNLLFAFTILMFNIISFKKCKSALADFKISPDFLLFVSCASFFFFGLSVKSHAFDRIAYIFGGLNIVALVNFICAYPAKKRFLFSFIVFAVFVIYSVICFVYRPEWGMPLPYRFFF